MTRDEVTAVLNARALAEGSDGLKMYLAMRDGARMQKLAPVMRPFVMTAAQLDALAATTVALRGATLELLRAWRQGAFAEEIKVPAIVEAQVAADIDRGAPLGHVRFDFSWDPETGRASLFEIQAGDPSGMGVQHVQAEFWQNACASVGGRCDSIASSLRRFIAPEGANAGLVVFAIPRGAYLQFDHEIVSSVFRAEGVDAVTLDPDELELDGGALVWRRRRVDRVVRDSLEDLLMPEFVENSRALLDAWRAGAVRVFNPAGAIVADHKVLLSLLSDEQFLSRLPEATRGLVRAATLRTRKLEASLRAEVLANRESLVLKPSDGYGGFGVVVGPSASKEAWTTDVDAALASGRTFIVQEYVAPPHEEVPVPHHSGVALERVNIVLSAWMHGERFGGVFVRTHPGHVVNVHQGGGLLPVCVVKGQAG